MNENKSTKVSLGMVTCIVIILILIIALMIMYYFGVVDNKNKADKSNNVNTNNYVANENKNNINTDNTINFKPDNYIIKFDADLLGEEFEESGNEIKECNYEISFLNNNEFNIYMGFGNSVEGTYTIDNNIINCKLTSLNGEYSPSQEINGEISFKINSDSEIEIIDIPEFYTIRTSEAGENGWVLTDETKEMRFWPLVKGIKYTFNK